MTKADLIAALERVQRSLEYFQRVSPGEDAYLIARDALEDLPAALSEINKLLPDDGPGESQPRVHRPNKCDPGPCDFRPGVPLMCCINCEEYY